MLRNRIKRYAGGGPLLMSALLLAGCAVDAKDHTPAKFPGVPVNDPALYTNTPQQLFQLARDPAHRFAVEIKPTGGVSNISASITVNGTESQMQRAGGGTGGGVWIYQSPSECATAYNYSIRVRYRRELFGSAEVVIPPTGTKTVEVERSGHLVWYEIFGPARSSNGTIQIMDQVSNNETRIWIQNLSQAPIRVDGIGFSTSGDATKFQQFGRPTLPLVLNCGDSFDFGVRWNPVGNDRTDSVNMGIATSTNLGGGFAQDPNPIIITINGVPYTVG